MRLSRYALELLFGIGFKIGFLIAVIGMFMMYVPLIKETLDPLLEYIGFWTIMRSSPQWVRVFSTGLILMVAAIIISLLKNWIEPLIDVLFWEDKPSKTK
jgi:hypothetical protein